MFSKNVNTVERLLRLLLGAGLVFWGYSISGVYWLGYQVPTFPLNCWDWGNFISHACMVERGFAIAVVGVVPLVTGLINWCPLKAIFGLKA